LSTIYNTLLYLEGKHLNDPTFHCSETNKKTKTTKSADYKYKKGVQMHDDMPGMQQ
jgi:hypothetical protein